VREAGAGLVDLAPVMVEPVSGPAAGTPHGRGCAAVGGAVLGGAILGLIVGAPAGFSIGMAWLYLLPHPSAGREIGLLVIGLFMPLGAMFGSILGTVVLGRRAARWPPTTLDRVLHIIVAILAVLAVPGFVFMMRIFFFRPS